jgi:hypothetical protein
MNLVIDKSFLQGSSTELIRKYCCEHRIIMTEALLMEILTTEKENMQKCFAKFSNFENPVALLPNAGTLLRYEVKTNSPCTPIEKQFINERFVFNPKLSEGSFCFTDEQKITLKSWNNEIDNESERFIKKAIITQSWFPELNGYRPGTSTDIIARVMQKVANDNNFIISIYDQIRSEIRKERNEDWPDACIINENWAIFRYYQVHLLSTVEYIRKYGFSLIENIRKELINFRIDIDYCVIGALADGLLTNDKKMAQFFSLLCPKKMLIFS